jgi:hypothetical protein
MAKKVTTSTCHIVLGENDCIKVILRSLGGQHSYKVYKLKDLSHVIEAEQVGSGSVKGKEDIVFYDWEGKRTDGK